MSINNNNKSVKTLMKSNKLHEKNYHFEMLTHKSIHPHHTHIFKSVYSPVDEFKKKTNN